MDIFRRLLGVVRGACAPAVESSSPSGARIIYTAHVAGWDLRAPCQACGGALLALPTSQRSTIRGALIAAQRYLDRAQAEGCPSCRTREERARTGAGGPAVYYDTLVGDWMACIQVNGSSATATMPLEIGWFDADEAIIRRAAQELSSVVDELVDPPRFE